MDTDRARPPAADPSAGSGAPHGAETPAADRTSRIAGPAEEPWQIALEAHRRLWDHWTDLHVAGGLYDVDRFRAGSSTLCPVELAEVGEVRGKSLLHLQCHFGLDTLSWARLGARVTGVDLSPKAIETARGLASELGLDARFLACDLYDLPELLDERFDLVFTSYGVLPWLHDLGAWARLVARYLAPDGAFHLVEFHPLLETLDDSGRPFAHPYFPTGEPVVIRESGSYMKEGERGGGADDGSPRSATTEEVSEAATEKGPGQEPAGAEHTSFTWPHSLGETLTALAQAGLRLEYLHEHPESPFDCFPFTRATGSGAAVVPGLEGKLPMLFSLRAVAG